MLISGTFLKSKVSQRIALLLFISAVVPAMLMTLLSNEKLNTLITNYEHKGLIEKSRSYALSAFSNLTFARNKFKDEINTNQSIEQVKNLSINFALKNVDIFNSVIEILPNGTVLKSDNTVDIPQVFLQNLDSINPDVVNLMVWPNKSPEYQHSINLIMRQVNNNASSIYIATINPRYLWGDKVDYPSDLSVCAYQLNGNAKNKLFCSSENSHNTKLAPINSGAWELFLAGEFHDNPWLFETNRLYPITSVDLKGLVGSEAYIGIALLSLLIIGLLSLIQIRKTMVPLEQLIQGTKKIAEGDFTSVKVDGNSEFSELATAFNAMSAYIKQQFNTLQALSKIDREIISKIDIEQVTQLVINRMQTLKPDAIILIANLESQSESHQQCNCTVASHSTLSTLRLSLSPVEINSISLHQQGEIKRSSVTSSLAHERLMAELGAKHLWVYPVFWQGNICAFIAVGCKTTLKDNNPKWSEFRDLASRVGIAIATHEREQKLLLEAQYDNLTGLPNRILLQDRLKLAMEHSDYTGKAMWVVFIDLDRFKVVNDSMGHTIGDELLKEIGSRLLAETRDSDTVARFGGDEFVIVLSGDAGENIQLSVLNRIMETVAEPAYINNHELITSCSIGIAVYPNDGNNAETLIKNADIAMYRAKELGRNNYQFFTQDLNDKAAERMQMISLLRKAIEHHELTLHYQPKVDLHTSKVVGLEALLRWYSPTLGNVSPDKFIPVAEEAGLIASIGEWVLQTACQQMVVWQQAGIKSLLMSVNVSARQFQEENFVEKIQSILLKTGLKAENLELELTENILMDGSDQTINTLNTIQSLGMTLSIDDFGTGYSNLSYLHKLPIHILKIDKAFIDAITASAKKAPIVDTIIHFAQNLNLKVVAEGVENVDQANYLKKQGCDQIQGYFFSKPLPVDAATALLASGKKLSLLKQDI
jgi:diguanylate cyclase (GGDEF)-like protein